MHLRFVAPLAVVLGLLACTNTEYVVKGGTTSPTDPVEGGTVPIGGDAGTGDAATPKTPKQMCEALIACVADISPSQAGPLVTLYGDASNCWKGGQADADACGKACAKELEEREECSAAPLDGNYVALCTGAGSSLLRYHVQLVFDPRKGGNAVFRPLPPQVTTFKASAAVMTQPTLTLHIESDGGAGKSTTPFDMPGAILSPGLPTVHVESFEVTRLRKAEAVCSSLKAQVGAPINSQLDGQCLYFPIKEGDPMPSADSSSISECRVSGSPSP